MSYKETEVTREYEWIEDGATFSVTEYSDNVHLSGTRFAGGTITSNEAVLAREILSQQDKIDTLLALIQQNTALSRASYKDVLEELAKTSRETSKLDDLAKSRYHDLAQLEADNLRLTDRVNALTARIEEALDLILYKTEEGGKIEEAYRKLETALLNRGGSK